jgi:hypothetical protein
MAIARLRTMSWHYTVYTAYSPCRLYTMKMMRERMMTMIQKNK